MPIVRPMAWHTLCLKLPRRSLAHSLGCGVVLSCWTWSTCRLSATSTEAPFHLRVRLLWNNGQDHRKTHSLIFSHSSSSDAYTMSLKILALLSGALLAAAAPGTSIPGSDFKAETTMPTRKRAAIVKGQLFDRIMFIYLENTPYAVAVADR